MTLATAHPATLAPAKSRPTLLALTGTPWGRYIASGVLDGYTPGPPPGAVDICIAIDRDVAESDCHCGARRDWRPFYKPGSYLSFSVCSSCGRWWSL